MSDVIMPRLTDSMQEGAIAKWLKADGEEVRRGEELVEIETDKATMAYEADFSGVLRIVVAEGETVSVGTVIGQIGEAAPVAAPAAGAVADAGAATAARAAMDAGAARDAGAATDATDAGAARGAGVASGNGDGAARRRPRQPGASPLARRIAERLGIDLGSVSGSGAYGRILKLDVVAAADRGGSAEAGAVAAGDVVAGVAGAAGAGDVVAIPGGAVAAERELQPLNRTQAIVARRMVQSRQTVPDFAVGVDVDMSECLRMRAHHLDRRQIAAERQQIMVNRQCDLTGNRHRRGQQYVERPGHRAFGRILHRHHTELGGAGLDRAKHVVDRCARQTAHRMTEVVERGLLAIGSDRTQIGGDRRLFKRPAGRHDLAPDIGDVLVMERAVAHRLQTADDLLLALRAKHRGIKRLLHFAHRVRNRSAIIEQANELGIDRVDLRAQRYQLGFE